jgi:carboxyl-terminal processing protease
VQKIRGPKGTTVKLTVSRSGSDQPLELTIKRSNIQVKSVTWKMIDTVGYVEISQFGEDTVALAQQAVKELAAKNPKAMIIDLRNNPGGYLNTVAPIAGLFIPPSVVVIERYKDSKTDEIRSTDVPVLPTTPLYLLVNEGSASAAEILAGALQDYKRATLVGHKTFGKGSVQDLIDLKGGAALRITIAEWLTPNQRAINKIGIEPDVTVEGDKKDGADPILDKALDLAKK